MRRDRQLGVQRVHRTGICGRNLFTRSNQAVDAAYGKKIAEYTTDPQFNSPLTDYLPASATVPTPRKCSATSPARRTCCRTRKMSYRYFDLLAQASPRVKVFRIGKSEEGREMIAVAIADEILLADSRTTMRASRNSPIRARSVSTTRRPTRSSRNRRRSTTSPARSIRPKPARRPR